MRSELAAAEEPDSSAPPDPEPNGFAQEDDPQEKDFSDVIKLPEGLSIERLLEWAKKKKKRHQEWFGDNNGYNEKILDYWKAYDGKLLAGQQAPTSVPVANSIVETDNAKTYQALTSRAKVVDAQPMEAQVNNENKQTVEDLINQEILWSRVNTGKKLFSTLKALKIEGTGVARVRWEKRMIEKIPSPMQMDPITGENIQTKTIVDVRKFREVHGPNWDSVPVQNMIWDHRAECLQDSEYVAEMQFPTLTDLLIMQDEGKITNVDAIQKLAGGNSVENRNPDAKRKQQLAPSGNGPMEAGESHDEKRLDEWFAMVPYQEVQEDGSKKWTKCSLHFMIVNDEVLIMAESNPWLDETGEGPGHPYFGFHQCIVPRSFLGKSVLAPIMETQTYINNLMSSTQKLVNKAARNPTFVSRAAGLDTLRLFTDELTVIPVQDASQVKYNPIDGAAIKAVSEERSWAINMARETVAASEQAQGIPTTVMGNATATEASIINANNGTRFQLIVDQLNYEFFGVLANLFWWMIRQWMKEGDMVVRESTIDGAPRTIKREDLVDDYYFVPITAAVINDARALLQQQLQFLQQVQQLQATNPAAMTDATGKQYRFDVFDFLVQEIMPKLDIRNGRTYMKEVLPMPAPGMPPGMPAEPGAPAGPGAGGPTVPVQRQLPFGPQTPVSV